MIEIELTRKRITIVLVVFGLLAAILGSGAVNLVQNYDWKSLADPAKCYITPPARGTDLTVQLTQLPQIATTDFAPEAAANSKTTVYLLLCDGTSYVRHMYLAQEGSNLSIQYVHGEYVVAVVTAESPIPFPTPGPGYPP